MKKILIADDSSFMRTVIRGILSGEFEIVEAASGGESLERFERTRPDLVLLDIVMPEGEEEGLRVLRRIMERNPSAKVVMITALGHQDAVLKECLALGAKGCILKPFDETHIRKTVKECLG